MDQRNRNSEIVNLKVQSNNKLMNFEETVLKN
jgi:hypothetical protein